ncbi:MAG: SAM-dependent methyltransferase [Sphingomicrobium sp.]
MTPLEQALRERIRRDGPLSVEAYMDACNTFYYATRDPLGAAGDFTTAPEISQMYGEMIGAALADCWHRAGRPGGVRYAELGPGRGTLAADALRTMAAAGLEPDAIELVETSPLLRAEQCKRLPSAIFHESIEGLADGNGPLLLVASEFFDALPVRQTVGGVERRVVVSGGSLAFDRGGAIVETSPARDEAARQVATLLAHKGGAALIVDYGHDQAGAVGDTLQAVRGHRFAYPLEHPGEQDLTAHVDFAALAGAARLGGARVGGPVSQGSWLETLGIAARASTLAAKNPAEAEGIAAARRRLCDEAEMGRLFKVMALAGAEWPMIAGFE